MLLKSNLDVQQTPLSAKCHYRPSSYHSPQGYNEEYDPENVTSLPLSIFWTEPAPGKASDVMVSSKKLKAFKADLKKLDLKFTIQVSKLKYFKRPGSVTGCSGIVVTAVVDVFVVIQMIPNQSNKRSTVQ